MAFIKVKCIFRQFLVRLNSGSNNKMFSGSRSKSIYYYIISSMVRLRFSKLYRLEIENFIKHHILFRVQRNVRNARRTTQLLRNRPLLISFSRRRRSPYFLNIFYFSSSPTSRREIFKFQKTIIIVII